MAVTGLPEPQENHATIMAEFATQCLMQVNPVLYSLVDKLGTEVTELSLRFGLNSGPVTAGVLRGEKARFQLYVLKRAKFSSFCPYFAKPHSHVVKCLFVFVSSSSSSFQ